jgi:hypothetical protein
MKVGKVARHTLVVAVLAVLLMVASASAQAQTPDSTPPTNEGVCSGLRADGVTPALFGLCVSYCETLDCDVQQGQSPQCRVAGEAILKRYNVLRSATDPTMPCIQQAACPCWSAQEVGAIGFSWYPNNIVDWFPNDFPGAYSTYSLVENRLVTDQQPYGAYQVAGVMYWVETGPECSYFHYDAQTYPDGYIVRSQPISVPEADACKAQLDQQLDSLQSSGVPVKCTGNLCP